MFKLPDLPLHLKQAGFIIILILAGLVACREGKHKPADKSLRHPAEIVKVAGRLSIKKDSLMTEVTIKNPWQGVDNVSKRYILLDRGSEVPEGTDPSEVVFVPVRKIICMSTTHLSMICALGMEETISGMSGTDFMYSEKLRKKAEAGQIADVGYETNLNKELILKLRPDLLMIYGIGSESAGYVARIEELGIRTMYNADYLENDPVGKAEWIRLFGSLFCLEEKADSIFREEQEAYGKIRSYISENSSRRPKVLLGMPFKDTWFISPGNSFISKLISDAGGDYLWNDTRSARAMPYGLENVFVKALDADYWMNIGTAASKSDIAAVDPRLTELPCFKSGNLYNNNNRVTEKGGNDFWEGGTVYPHLLLNDIAAILHPDIYSGYKLIYYKKVN